MGWFGNLFALWMSLHCFNDVRLSKTASYCLQRNCICSDLKRVKRTVYRLETRFIGEIDVPDVDDGPDQQSRRFTASP